MGLEFFGFGKKEASNVEKENSIVTKEDLFKELDKDERWAESGVSRPAVFKTKDLKREIEELYKSGSHYGSKLFPESVMGSESGTVFLLRDAVKSALNAREDDPKWQHEKAENLEKNPAYYLEGALTMDDLINALTVCDEWQSTAEGGELYTMDQLKLNLIAVRDNDNKETALSRISTEITGTKKNGQRITFSLLKKVEEILARRK